jgi:hypothetical protein
VDIGFRKKIRLKRRAAVAQLVEQRIRNAWVGGSNPFRGTKTNSTIFAATCECAEPLIPEPNSCHAIDITRKTSAQGDLMRVTLRVTFPARNPVTHPLFTAGGCGFPDP